MRLSLRMLPWLALILLVGLVGDALGCPNCKEAVAAHPSLIESLEDLARRGQAAISADITAARDHRDERPDLFLSRMRGFLQKLAAGLGPMTPSRTE